MIWRRTVPCLLFATSLMVVPAAGWSQSAPAPEVRAAVILNFAKFTDWPALPPGWPLRLCILGDDRVAEILTTAIRGHQISGHGLEVSNLSADTRTGTCHLLFIGASALRRGTPLLDSARDLPILTVSDSDRFAQSTGMVELFIEADRMRFAINVDAVGRSGLRVSSRMLGLAKIVRDQHAS